MKKIFTYTLICLCAGLFFTSCRSNMTILKRHYSKGYYVASGKDKKATAPATVKTEKNEVGTLTAFPADSLSESTAQSSSDGLDNPIRVTNLTPISTAVQQEKQNKNTGVRVKQNQKLPSVINYHPVKSVKQHFLKKKAAHNNSTERDALSLFWIIILVVVILWALGLASGSFGGLINLLLLIALILLILWLLRIV